MAYNYSCKTCTSHTPTCHATCETYRMEKAEDLRLKKIDALKRHNMKTNSNGTYKAGKNPRHH